MNNPKLFNPTRSPLFVVVVAPVAVPVLLDVGAPVMEELPWAEMGMVLRSGSVVVVVRVAEPS